MVSDDILKTTLYSKISKAPLTDRCFIDLALGPTKKEMRNKGYWKFNASLLKNEDYCNKIRNLIEVYKNEDSVGDYTRRWEFTTFKKRQFTITFGVELSRKRKEYESNLLQEINSCCSKADLNSQ